MQIRIAGRPSWSAAWIGNLVVAALSVVALSSGHPFWVSFALLLLTIAVLRELSYGVAARRRGDTDWRPLRRESKATVLTRP